jgi:hypothetical protein
MPNLIDSVEFADLFLPARAPGRKSHLGSAGVTPQCAAVPTSTPKTANTSYSLDTEQAGKVGINYIGTGDLEVDKKMKVFIREYAKYDTCESTDGEATLQYGAFWRATVLIDESDATGKLNFAIVAASATLKNVTVQVSVNHQGFADQKAIDEAGQGAMEDTAQGLNVASFVKFSQDVEKAIRAVIQSSVTTPLQLIGIKPHDSEILLESVVRTFALSYIARGKKCLDPISDCPVKGDKIEKIIRGTYDSLSSRPCDASDVMTQLAAQRLLNGIKVSKGWF